MESFTAHAAYLDLVIFSWHSGSTHQPFAHERVHQILTNGRQTYYYQSGGLVCHGRARVVVVLLLLGLNEFVCALCSWELV